MKYKRIPQIFVIELVKQVTTVVNSIPKQNGVHMILSPCQIMTGLSFRMPKISMGQYVQGHVRGSSNTEEERTVNSLYIGPADNGSGHWVFKLDTKQPISVNKVTVIPMCQDFIDRVSKLGLEDGQPDGIQIGDAQGQLTIMDFLTEAGNDNSNASDKSLKHNKSYQKEFDDQLKEESWFMKMLPGNEPSLPQHKKEGNYISHKQQQDHFYRKGGIGDVDADDEEEK